MNISAFHPSSVNGARLTIDQNTLLSSAWLAKSLNTSLTFSVVMFGITNMSTKDQSAPYGG